MSNPHPKFTSSGYGFGPKLALFFQIAQGRNSRIALIFPFAFLLLIFPKIGFVFSNALTHADRCPWDSLWRTQNEQIGFDWLCFFSRPRTPFFHNILYNRYIRSFYISKIGFVFSNSFSQYAERNTNKLALFFQIGL